jgi:hypothetical protein
MSLSHPYGVIPSPNRVRFDTVIKLYLEAGRQEVPAPSNMRYTEESVTIPDFRKNKKKNLRKTHLYSRDETVPR